VRVETFASEALGVAKSYYLYLPSGYEESEKRYPVIYMLHGLGGNESNWTKLMKLTEAADGMALPAIVVMPDGDNSFYVNGATPADYTECRESKSEDYCVKSERYEDYMATDLVAHIDATYRSIASAEARAIGGLSMGGFGALMLAMRHQDVFSSVASHSGVAALLYTGPFPYVEGKAEFATDAVAFTDGMGQFGPMFRGLFGTEIQNWRDHDPAFLAPALKEGQLSIYLDCGTEDEFRLQNGASYLHEVLDKAGVTHSFTLLPGKHELSFWIDRIDDSLAFHMRHFESKGVVK